MAPDTSGQTHTWTMSWSGDGTPEVIVWHPNNGPSLYPDPIRTEPETPSAARQRRSREAGRSHMLAARLVPQRPRESRWQRPVRVRRACGSRHMVSR